MNTKKLLHSMCISIILVVLFTLTNQNIFSNGGEESDYEFSKLENLEEKNGNERKEENEHERKASKDEKNNEHKENNTHEKGGSEDEESSKQFSKSETYNMVRKGVLLKLAYNAEKETFSGTVENVSATTVNNVRVEIHLSNGTELGPNYYGNLDPSEKKDVLLNAVDQKFITWNAHAEVN